MKYEICSLAFLYPRNLYKITPVICEYTLLSVIISALFYIQRLENNDHYLSLLFVS